MTQRRYSELTGKGRKVFSVAVDVSDNHSPIIVVFRRDESGNEWNHHYRSLGKDKDRHIKRGRIMQDALWQRVEMNKKIELTRDEFLLCLNDTIKMYVEYVEVHDYDPQHARYAAVQETAEGYDAIKDLKERGELR